MSDGPWADYQSAPVVAPPPTLAAPAAPPAPAPVQAAPDAGPWGDYQPSAPPPTIQRSPIKPVPGYVPDPAGDPANGGAVPLTSLSDDQAKAYFGVPGDLKALGSGVVSGLGGMADMAALGAPGGTGAQSLTNSIMGAFGQRGTPIPRFSDVTDMLGGSYKPESTVQRYLKTIGEFAPNAAMGGEGIIPRIASVVAPAVMSQGARDVTGALGGGSAAQDVAGTVGALAGGSFTGSPAASAPLLSDADQGAADAISKVLPIGSPDLGDVRANLAAGRLPVSSGAPGLTQLAEHVVNTPGSGRVAIKEAVADRVASEPKRVLDAVQTHLGVDPGSAMGSTDDIVGAGRAAAKPLFDAALGDPTPVWNSQLEALSHRPVIKKAIAAVTSDKLNAGEDPNALGLTFMDSPGTNAWEAPGMPGETAAAPLTGIAGAPRLGKPSGSGDSLLQFIANNGGINDDGGEVSNMDGNLWHEGKPFQSKLVNDDGLGADRWAERAQDAGYLPAGSTPGPRDLFDAMGRELRGNPIYANQAAARGPSAGAISDEQAFHQANNAPDGAGPDAYQGSDMPQSEPVPMVQPTASTWDAVRQAVGRQVERNPITGRPLPDSQSSGNFGVRRAGQDLTSALAGDETGAGAAIPGLRDALNVSGDYLKVENAFDRAKGSLFNGPVSKFNDLWGSLGTGPEQDAARAALASDILDQSNAGRLKSGSFKTDGVQQKLVTAFGDKAQPFIDEMESGMRERGEYGALVGGSPTAYRTEVNKAFAPPMKKGFTPQAIADWGLTAVAAPHAIPIKIMRTMADKATAGAPHVLPWEDPATNARLGELLSSAPKMSDFLDQMDEADAARPASTPYQRLFARAPRLALSGAIGAGSASSPAQAAPRR